MNTAPVLLPQRRIFVPLALFIALIAFVGFWPTYFGRVLAGTVSAPLIIHIHAAVFVLWLALFITQAVLAATGRRALHIKLGPWVMAYGLFLIAVALLTTVAVFHQRVADGHFADATRRLFAPLRDMLVFAPFLAAGWIYRHKPEIHKRIMVAATTILLIAAVVRLAFLGRPAPMPQFLLVWLAPVYLAMAWDWYSRRIVHPVYVIAVAVMVSMRLMLPLRDTDAWLAFATWLARP
ncbi:MAG: hypothetical protein H7Y89_07980 [Steroidobacteraceae bacterium]|nr:hypothetical protein [Steroidobacteraceae bacterium]